MSQTLVIQYLVSLSSITSLHLCINIQTHGMHVLASKLLSVFAGVKVVNILFTTCDQCRIYNTCYWDHLFELLNCQTWYVQSAPLSFYY